MPGRGRICEFEVIALFKMALPANHYHVIARSAMRDVAISRYKIVISTEGRQKGNLLPGDSHGPFGASE